MAIKFETLKTDFRKIEGLLNQKHKFERNSKKKNKNQYSHSGFAYKLTKHVNLQRSRACPGGAGYPPCHGCSRPHWPARPRRPRAGWPAPTGILRPNCPHSYNGAAVAEFPTYFTSMDCLCYHALHHLKEMSKKKTCEINSVVYNFFVITCISWKIRVSEEIMGCYNFNSNSPTI